MGYEQLIGAGVDAIAGSLSGLAAFVPTTSDELNEKRLKELRRRAEIDALGLSDLEKEAYFNAISQQAAAGRKSLQDMQQQALMAFSDQGSGQALKLSQLAAEEAAKQEAVIGQSVLGADIAAKAEQLQELEDRAAYESARQQQKAQAVLSMLMPILATASEAGAQAATVAPAGPKQKKVKTLDGQELDPESQAYLDAISSIEYFTTPSDIQVR